MKQIDCRHISIFAGLQIRRPRYAELQSSVNRVGRISHSESNMLNLCHAPACIQKKVSYKVPGGTSKGSCWTLLCSSQAGELCQA